MSKILLEQTSHKASGQQAYRLEFGSDTRICSVSFRSSIQEPEIRGMLGAAQKTSYEKCGRAIWSYLDTHNLNYSGFSVREKLTEKRAPMKLARILLHAPSCSIIDRCIGNNAVYYGIMDYRHITERCCEGCYYAVARMPSARNGHLQYHVISQTFRKGASGEDEWSHFAIRKSDNGRHLVTLDGEDGCPVLTTFGCVDMMGLLINIADITTKQQAAEIANI